MSFPLPIKHTASESTVTSHADKAMSEIDVQLQELESAKQRMFAVLSKFADHLDSAGVLVPPMPEPEGKLAGETACNSPMGMRIRGVRVDLHGIAEDFERLLARLAV